ncbi:Membrane-bound alkaline phosphatase [Folsomia candida]|uniref:Alkaline phosphatase n=1 Tax=Folsomia candida TaxID=158441 RepID=A0A226EGY6_FOLCA|nr:Membrane-bound alkaline phosphatase [Folsomia candida]
MTRLQECSRNRQWSAISSILLVHVLLLTLHVDNTEAMQENNGDSLEEAMHPTLPVPSFMERSGSVNSYEDATHWHKQAKRIIKTKIRQHPIEQKAKNVIFFLGDGMSIPTVTSARIFKGQLENLTYGEEAALSFDQFPFTGVSKTYCSNSQVGDSACTATSYLCGSKGNYRTIGVTPDVQESDCSAQMDPANHVTSVLQWAQEAGLSTGIVTNTRVTHASPAGAYSHIAHRNWEQDDAVENSGFDAAYCDDIAEQLILKSPGRDINVILGGGRSAFLPKEIMDVEDPKRGKRRDGKNLIDTWIVDKLYKNGKYVTNREELLSVNTTDTDYLMGLFAYDHMDYADKAKAANDPTLEEMTRVAVEILRKNPNGFFLFVEGGKIDHAHHATNAKRALHETLEFEKAVKIGREMTDIDDTLIVVTSGTPSVDIPFWDLVGSPTWMASLPYTTISYANGPGYRQAGKNGKRKNIRGDNMEAINYRQITTVPMVFETHGGDDVLIFSSGPFAHLLTGVLDQSYIPHAIGYAACIGQGEKFCDDYAHLTGAR